MKAPGKSFCFVHRDEVDTTDSGETTTGGVAPPPVHTRSSSDRSTTSEPPSPTPPPPPSQAANFGPQPPLPIPPMSAGAPPPLLSTVQNSSRRNSLDLNTSQTAPPPVPAFVPKTMAPPPARPVSGVEVDFLTSSGVPSRTGATPPPPQAEFTTNTAVYFSEPSSPNANTNAPNMLASKPTPPGPPPPPPANRAALLATPPGASPPKGPPPPPSASGATQQATPPLSSLPFTTAASTNTNANTNAPPPRKLSITERVGNFAASITGKDKDTTTKAAAAASPPTMSTGTNAGLTKPFPATTNPQRTGGTAGGGPSPSSTLSTNDRQGLNHLTRGSMDFRSFINTDPNEMRSRFSISTSAAPSQAASLFVKPGQDTSRLQGQLEFYHLTHCAERVSLQVDRGLYACWRMIQMLKRTLSAEDDLHKQNIKTLEHETYKILRLNTQSASTKDMMQRANRAWIAWQKIQMDLAQKCLQVNAAITAQALVPLLEFHTQAAVKKKELDRDLGVKEKELHAARILLTKELQACEKLIEIWNDKKTEEEGGSATATRKQSAFSFKDSGASIAGGSPRGTEAPRQSFLNKISSAARAVSAAATAISFSSSAAVQEKLVAQSAKYNENLIICNRRQELFQTHELPMYLLELQKIEITRLELTRTSLEAHARLSRERSEALTKDIYQTALPQQVLAILNPHDDMDDLISDYIAQNGYAPVYAPLEYSLPVSIEEIKAGRIRGNPDSVFHVSLAHLMEVQQRSKLLTPAQQSLPVPRFLLYVLDAIRACNGGHGIEQEGVFRISPNKSEMDELKRKLNSVGIDRMKREDVPATNAFLMAALLKEWLRSLADSVIPTTSYNACIAIVKKAAAAEATATANALSSPTTPAPIGAAVGTISPSSSLSSSSSSSTTNNGANSDGNTAATSAALASLVASLPAVNQRVLQVLSDFVAELVSDEAQKKNRMTVENLSIVFAPCLLRSASEDPNELLMNSKFEIRFLVMLFKAMANAPSSVTMCVTQLESTAY